MKQALDSRKQALDGRKHSLTVELELPERAGYGRYYFSKPAYAVVKNGGTESVRVAVSLSSELFVFSEREEDIPAGGEVRISAEFSPVFLSENDVLRAVPVIAEVRCGQTLVARAEGTIQALPFDAWDESDPLSLLSFVRPDSPQVQALLSEVRLSHTRKNSRNLQDILQNTSEDALPHSNKNNRKLQDVLQILMSAVQSMRLKETPETGPVFCVAPIETKRATSLQAALLLCGALEKLSLRPVLAVGEGFGVGIWLYEAAFLSSCTDDCETVEKYLGDGVRHLCLLDASDLFAPVPLSLSEDHFLTRLRMGKYRFFLDVRRARMEGMCPLPLRGKGLHGYEVYREPKTPSVSVREKRSPLAVWEERLHDLSSRDPLADLSGKRVLRLCCFDGDELICALSRGLRLLPKGKTTKELWSMELRGGVLRMDEEGEGWQEALRHLEKRDRQAEEETGSRALYLVFGQLRYPVSGKTRRAPVALLPVRMERKRGQIVLYGEDEPTRNGVLFELLGEDVPTGESVRDLLSSVRALVAERKHWTVTEDTYLCELSFPRYAIWSDLHRNAEEFSHDPILSALLKKERLAISEPSLPTEDELLLPLPADSSQIGAVALSDTGTSFVLHGPPGTGKSQTIANMIANALGKGKKVLFVAEKKAACDVVKDRLQRIGIGSFCLELHAGKTDADVVHALRNYLREEREFCGERGKYLALREEIDRPFSALHAKNEGGMSAFDAIGRYLTRLHAPDVVEVKTASWTKIRLKECGERLRALHSAAKECGRAGEFFRDVRLEECSPSMREKILCAAEVYLARLKHLKGMASLFARALGQRTEGMTALGYERLPALVEQMKKSAFAGTDLAFLRVNTRLDDALSYYLRHFRLLLAGRASLLKNGDEKLFKRLSRVARHPLAREDLEKYRTTLREIVQCEELLRAHPLSSLYCVRSHIDGGKRRRVAEGLYALRRRAEEVFSPLDEESFVSSLARVREGTLDPLLDGVTEAAEGCRLARELYFSSLGSSPREESLDDAMLSVSSLIENIDLLPVHCGFVRSLRTLEEEGVRLLPEAFSVDAEALVADFEKKACAAFVRARLEEENILPEAEGSSLSEEFRLADEEERNYAAATIGNFLLSQRQNDKRGALLHALEEKRSVRSFFDLFWREGALPPCLLMSPSSVARLLPPEKAFDLVVFDEASQLTLSEAAGAIARGRCVVVAGDEKQLPPTSFFRSEQEEKSILDDFISLGMPERTLTWHYRSRHESLIAFSNAQYYHNSLRTFPSPSKESRVKLFFTGGTYDRGGSKKNGKEAESIAEEVLRRLRDPELSQKSMGIVALSDSQREEIEKRVQAVLSEENLSSLAYEREEPLFCKNLENVQGDERDVIFLSVGYGPDSSGKLSSNFGPLNRVGGGRRLNVALSRAREELCIFSSLRSSQIGTEAGGMKELLRYAENGASLPSTTFKETGEIAMYLASELARYGYRSKTGVGTSSCRVDVGVYGKDGNFLLGILFGRENFTAREREILIPQALLSCGWELLFPDPVRLFFNPEREVKRIKERLDGLSGEQEHWLSRCAVSYRAVKTREREQVSFFTDGRHDGAIEERLRRIVSVEQPISRAFLRRRCLQSFGIPRGGGRAEARIDAIIDRCHFPCDVAAGKDYFYSDPRALRLGRVRLERGEKRRGEEVTAYEILSLLRSALGEKVSFYEDEACSLAEEVFSVHGEKFSSFVRDCISYGEQRGVFVRSRADRISLR